MKNQIITSEGNVQFIYGDSGKVINVHPFHVYTVFNLDTISFILIAMPKSSGLALFTTKAEDLELNGTTYSFTDLPSALAEAFSEAGAQARAEIVDELPTSGKTNTIYLVPKESGSGFDEYIYIKETSTWELLGDTDIELSRYMKKDDFNAYSASTASALSGKQDTLIAGDNITIVNNVISAVGGSSGEVTSAQVQSMIDSSISGKANSTDVETLSGTVTAHTADTTIHVTTAQTAAWNAKSDFSGSYNDLTDKPTIPTVSSTLTSGDTNAVAGGAVYDQVTIGGGSGMVEITAVTITSWASASMPDCDKFTISASTAIGNQLTQGGSLISVYEKSTDEFKQSFAYVSDINSSYVTVEGTTADTSIALTAVDGYYFKGSDSMYFKSNYSTGWVVTFYRLAEVMSWLKDVVSAHTSNNDIHVTAEQKSAWDAKPSATAVTAQINAATSGLQETLSAGTNITIVDNVISATGGGGATYTAGRGISITSDTISVSLPISAGTGTNSIKENNATRAQGNYSHAEGLYTNAYGVASHVEGNATYANGDYSHAEGYNNYTYNEAEHASGRYNYSVRATSDFGDSGNTLFSVGNGRLYDGEPINHNAFEIKQNGDIYIVNTDASEEYYEKPLIKLQDSLGGTVSSAITSGDTNAVAGGAVYDKFDEVEQVTARALNDLNDKFDGLRLKKLTQAQYNALSPNYDSSTLYVIVN